MRVKEAKVMKATPLWDTKPEGTAINHQKSVICGTKMSYAQKND